MSQTFLAWLSWPEVCESREARALVRDGVVIAEIVPTRNVGAASPLEQTPEMRERFLKTAGSMPDFDVEAFERHRAESRALVRPPVEL